jgi:hypothetical protein
LNFNLTRRPNSLSETFAAIANEEKLQFSDLVADENIRAYAETTW